jgi:diadenosine tetraphosphate (Ap4A) HIT family hydrolase
LPPAEQAAFLADMARVGEALRDLTGAARINYAIFGNLEPALHAHVIPRFETEPEAFRTKPYFAYDLSNAPLFDPDKHGDLKARIQAALGTID